MPPHVRAGSIGMGVAMLFALPALGAKRGEASEPAEDLPQLQARLTRILNDTHTPGLGVVLANRDGILWTAGLGMADVAAGKPATADTLFRVASISKMFVGFAVLKLVEEGRLDLQTPVRQLVPEVGFTNRWEATDPVRVVHLLEHTTGWDELHPKEFVYDDPHPVTLAQGLALGPDSRVSRWRPGTRYAYTSSGPAVAAAIVEKLTGKRFEDYVREAFFDPLGMATADFFNTSPRTRGLLATPYRADGKTPLPFQNFALRPSGSLTASAREMGAVLLFLLRRGASPAGRLLSEASIRRTETPATSYGARAGISFGHGLGNGPIYDHRGRVWRGHSGGLIGARSELYYLADHGVGYFFAINVGSDRAEGEIGRELMAYLTKASPPPTFPEAQPVPAELPAAYAGWYVPANPRIGALAPVDEILGLTRLGFADTSLQKRPLIGSRASALALGGALFRQPASSVPNVALVETPEGRALIWNEAVFMRISTLRAWAEILVVALLLVAAVSVPMSTMGARATPAARLLPLVAWLSLVAGALLARLAAGGGEEAPARFGHVTAWSVGLTAAIWAFAVSSFASLLAAAWAFKRPGRSRRLVRGHDLAAAIVFVIVTVYLACQGVIGYRTWA